LKLTTCRNGAAGGLGVDNPVLLILIVEDDFLTQELVNGALAEGGFQTEITASGEDAITLLQGDGSKYRALLTDIHLNGELTGWDVAKRAREINPEIPVVYMTGNAADQWPSHGVPRSVLLNKPFAPAQVVTAISQLLNEAPPPQE
jgi:CheY-like chemotaxis protein